MVGLTILQAPPESRLSGRLGEYPNLSWVQPTFPAADTRYTISKDRPLVLRYRLWIRAGKQTPETIGGWWDAYQADASRNP